MLAQAYSQKASHPHNIIPKYFFGYIRILFSSFFARALAAHD
jgi:hypothetical protein